MGHGAVLVEQAKDSRDIFTASVGNLLPGQVSHVNSSVCVFVCVDLYCMNFASSRVMWW